VRWRAGLGIGDGDLVTGDIALDEAEFLNAAQVRDELAPWWRRAAGQDGGGSRAEPNVSATMARRDSRQRC
jgi:hypothetical protein